MNKSLKIAKMNFVDVIKAVGVFYLILLVVLTGLFSISAFSNGNSSTSGLEIASMIFIFVCGLNSFKENFYFAQSNNISRKSFLGGIILSIFPVAIIMAIIDFIINRIMNLFMSTPSLYDIGYTVLRTFDNWSLRNEWVQSNSILTIINTILLAFVIYCFAYILGLVINMIYFRCNTIMKIAVSVIGGSLLMTILSDIYFFKGLALIFGINTQNVYMGVLVSIVIFIILAGVSYLIIKEATIKEK